MVSSPTVRVADFGDSPHKLLNREYKTISRQSNYLDDFKSTVMEAYNLFVSGQTSIYSLCQLVAEFEYQFVTTSFFGEEFCIQCDL